MRQAVPLKGICFDLKMVLIATSQIPKEYCFAVVYPAQFSHCLEHLVIVWLGEQLLIEGLIQLCALPLTLGYFAHKLCQTEKYCGFFNALIVRMYRYCYWLLTFKCFPPKSVQDFNICNEYNAKQSKQKYLGQLLLVCFLRFFGFNLQP